MSTTTPQGTATAESFALRSIGRSKRVPPPHFHPAIKVVGVGNTGADLLDTLVRAVVQGDVEFVRASINNDRPRARESASKAGPAPHFAGFDGADVVILLASAKNVADLHAANIVARTARHARALVIAMVAQAPVSPAGTGEVLAAVADCADALIPLPPAPTAETFLESSRRYIHATVSGLSEAFGPTAPVGIDFLDVRTIFAQRGETRIGIGQASGAGRAVRAAEQAIDDISDSQLMHASGVLVLVAGSASMALGEFAEAMHAIQGMCGAQAVLTLGVHEDQSLDDGLRVTVIAAGSATPA
ncbi:hypothetical protein RA280_38910 [Cupriavidus sp. CV2]|uniref:hypothetical protein n=1 Tax=Cupriavidus ulmosensis TaxID=3065913 RepID=UPI00296AF66F|nr:hypothetical protein [Cupriavidus sp. CV2]MDW3687604.1 hypothetical protein [Cupriavidus sp. CV2]